MHPAIVGPADHILDSQYKHHCNTALEVFCAILWPCTFRSKRGEQCVNVKERHVKGHQNQRGSVIGSGPYESNFTYGNACAEWFHHLKTYLRGFQDKLQSQLMLSKTDETVLVTKLHHAKTDEFYRRAGGALKFFSQSTCFCCLGDLAEHPLPCGHVLCTPCVKDYGRPHDELSSSYIVWSCPLHNRDFGFHTPTEIYFKPPLAGLRILSLDG